MNPGSACPQPWCADFAATAPFHHVASLAAHLAGGDWPRLQRLNDLAAAQHLVNAAGLPLRFAAQRQRCGQRDYEASILARAEVPSRERNWHDLFNALTWLSFPRAKAALNLAQCTALLVPPGRMARGPRSDAATLFDESGVLLLGVSSELAELLRARRWQEAFVQRRALWAGARAYVFGHAILEKLLRPWPGITGKCLFLAVDDLPDPELPAAWLDAALAEVWMSDEIRCPADLFPLPVLGIPGWWPANADAAFYQDARVFRPGVAGAA